MPPPSYAPSSMYSQNEVNAPSLGYRPFEYWRGPKPVAWPSTRQPHHDRKTAASSSSSTSSSPSGRGVARSPPRSSPNANTSLQDWDPIQPSKLHAAQQFVASLQAARLGREKHSDNPTAAECMGGDGGGMGRGSPNAAGRTLKPGSSMPQDSIPTTTTTTTPTQTTTITKAEDETALSREHKGWAAPRRQLPDDDYDGLDKEAGGGVRILLREVSRTPSRTSTERPLGYACIAPLDGQGAGGRDWSRDILFQEGGADAGGGWWSDARTIRPRTWAIIFAALVSLVLILITLAVMVQKRSLGVPR